ncbi:hypothetical protein HOO65_100018 [Ceratocystis lukuohia]|uniref:Uncharacterized protein n=1 Tax=Ceratocystis lukuohia TaxID=2019550 RepID=A0ABR4M8P0_9PEZI
MVNRLPAGRDALPVGKHWAPDFAKRQLDLKTRFHRIYGYERAKYADPIIIHGRFRPVKNTNVKHGINLAHIYNFSKFGFMMGAIAGGLAIIGTERRGKANSVQCKSQEWVIAIQAINAEGYVVAPFIVTAGRRL